MDLQTHREGSRDRERERAGGGKNPVTQCSESEWGGGGRGRRTNYAMILISLYNETCHENWNGPIYLTDAECIANQCNIEKCSGTPSCFVRFDYNTKRLCLLRIQSLWLCNQIDWLKIPDERDESIELNLRFINKRYTTTILMENWLTQMHTVSPPP